MRRINEQEKSDVLRNLRSIITVERSRRWTTMNMETRKVSSFIAEPSVTNFNGMGVNTYILKNVM